MKQRYFLASGHISYKSRMVKPGDVLVLDDNKDDSYFLAFLKMVSDKPGSLVREVDKDFLSARPLSRETFSVPVGSSSELFDEVSEILKKAPAPEISENSENDEDEVPELITEDEDEEIVEESEVEQVSEEPKEVEPLAQEEVEKPVAKRPQPKRGRRRSI